MFLEDLGLQELVDVKAASSGSGSNSLSTFPKTNLSLLSASEPLPWNSNWDRLPGFWLIRQYSHTRFVLPRLKLIIPEKKGEKSHWPVTRREKRKGAECAVTVNWSTFARKMGRFSRQGLDRRGNGACESWRERMVGRGWERFASMNFGMKDRLVCVLCVCQCFSVCMFVCLRDRVNECQREKAWVCWDKRGSLWGSCFPGTLWCVCACVLV